MNVDNNHLKEVFEDNPEIVEKMKEQGYVRVPEELEHAAKVKLAGKEEAYVSKTSGGKLSKWAAKQRKAKRAKNKIARASRKKNRK